MNKLSQSADSALLNSTDIDSIWDIASQQMVFRKLVNAMSRPGATEDLKTIIGRSDAYRAVLAVLVDGEVSLNDRHGLLNQNDWPLLQAKHEEVETADYILCNGNREPDFQPKVGSLPCPDQSATLILVVNAIGEGETIIDLAGPGVNGKSQTAVRGLHNDWLEQRELWNSAFPLGVDMIILDQHQLVALPRTARIEVKQ